MEQRKVAESLIVEKKYVKPEVTKIRRVVACGGHKV